LETLINAKAGEAKEEAQYAREMQMNSLKNRIRELETKDLEHEVRINDIQNEKLDLLFEKENFDLKISRLQKKIVDLEAYKMTAAQLSSADPYFKDA
jgi:hypothetical protein